MDSKGFDKAFKDLTQVLLLKGAKDGEFEAANEVLNDSITKPPQAPFKKGDLWGSRKVEAVKESSGDISIEFGFNIKYAMKQHEAAPGTYKYTKDPKGKKGATQPGPKFMQSKMSQYKDKYIGIVADAMKRKGKS